MTVTNFGTMHRPCYNGYPYQGKVSKFVEMKQIP